MSLKTLSAVLKVHQDFASFVSVTSVLTWQRLMVRFFFLETWLTNFTIYELKQKVKVKLRFISSCLFLE